MNIEAIIPTAGLGRRFKAKSPKALVRLQGQPIVVHTLKIFEKSSWIDGIILVAPRKYLPAFREIVYRYHFHKVKKVIAGGHTRSKSVKNGLKAIDADTDLIVVHDGVRPLLSQEILAKAIKLGKRFGAVVTAVPVKSTIKKVNKKMRVVQETLNRDELWEIQTPQVFKKGILVKAYNTVKNLNPTDDAMLVEQLGVKVKVLEGDYKNIKITTPEDLRIAEIFLKGSK